MFTTDLQDTTLALVFQVTVLEENRRDGGNSSVAELEVRVETPEGTAAGHGIRISAAESDINGKRFCCNLRLIFLLPWIAVLKNFTFQQDKLKPVP